MEREEGYYWVNLGWEMPDGMENDQAWVVAEFKDGFWTFTETGQQACFSHTEKDKRLSERFITEIDENKIIRK